MANFLIGEERNYGWKEKMTAQEFVEGII